MCSRRLVHWYIVRKLDKTFWTCSSQWGTGTLVPCNSDNRMRREYQYVITIIIIAPCNIGKKSEITTRTHDMGKYGGGDCPDIGYMVSGQIPNFISYVNDYYTRFFHDMVKR